MALVIVRPARECDDRFTPQTANNQLPQVTTGRDRWKTRQSFIRNSRRGLNVFQDMIETASQHDRQSGPQGTQPSQFLGDGASVPEPQRMMWIIQVLAG